MSASDKALRAAKDAAMEHNGNFAPEGEDRGTVEAALRAAHDPALGLDRSVCLRDVVEGGALLEKEVELHQQPARCWAGPAADFIKDEFGGVRDG